MVGPQGHPPGGAVLLIRPFRNSLSPENGFLLIHKWSHLVKSSVFKQEWREGKRTPKEVTISPGMLLALRAGTWVEFPESDGGIFISKGYACDISEPDFTSEISEEYRSEEDLVHFMRYLNIED